jgi:hypothetical protein
MSASTSPKTPTSKNPLLGAAGWIAGICLLAAICAGLAAPGDRRPAFAQGSEPTFTPPTPYQCMYIQYAYMTDSSVVVGVNNNTGSTTRFQNATLTWPPGLGGSGGDYVDYFQWNGNQFYNGNDANPPTSANASNNSTYQILSSQTLEFLAVFGAIPLNRPLYGTFTVTLLFRNGCSVSISILREPPPTPCAAVTNAYISGNNLIYVVYNNLGADTNFTGATLEWPDIPSPNRYVNYFRWGTDQFYGGNDYDPPTTANDPSPDSFPARETSFFTANFGNPGTLAGAFTVTLNFTGCSTTYTFWYGITPTPTSTPTITRTPTETPTQIPLTGSPSVRYSALLLNAPDFGLPAQTILGSVVGGSGSDYTIAIHIKAPSQSEADATVYSVDMNYPGSFQLTPADTPDIYLGCSEVGIWQAWFVVTDGGGSPPATSNRITWAVNFPTAHGIP